jgi:hypothetical protein
VHTLIEALDAASKEFATRRMNRAIARALEGKKIDDVSGSMSVTAAPSCEHTHSGGE